MVVIVILGLLATLVVPRVMDSHVRAMKGKAISDINAISSALDTYAISNMGRYPESLEALVTKDVNGYTYLKQKSVPLDPWQRPYGYEMPSGSERSPRVFTQGADGEPGGDAQNADLDNWQTLDRQAGD